jgi:hypothetical protein
MIPSFIELEQARKRGEAIGQGVSGRVQCQESQLGQPAFVDEDIGKRRVADGILQLEDSHLAHRLLLRAEAGDEFRDIDAVHVSSCERAGGITVWGSSIAEMAMSCQSSRDGKHDTDARGPEPGV